MKPFTKSFSAMLLGACVMTSMVFPETVYADTANPVNLHFVQGKMYYTDLSPDGIDSFLIDAEGRLGSPRKEDYNKVMKYLAQ